MKDKFKKLESVALIHSTTKQLFTLDENIHQEYFPTLHPPLSVKCFIQSSLSFEYQLQFNLDAFIPIYLFVYRPPVSLVVQRSFKLLLKSNENIYFTITLPHSLRIFFTLHVNCFLLIAYFDNQFFANF